MYFAASAGEMVRKLDESAKRFTECFVLKSRIQEDLSDNGRIDQPELRVALHKIWQWLGEILGFED